MITCHANTDNFELLLSLGASLFLGTRKPDIVCLGSYTRVMIDR
jgi:hypothetical protein